MLTSDCIIDTLTRHRRAWFDLDGRGAVYLRDGNRAINGDFVSSLTLANVNVLESCRRCGVFSETVALLERTARELGREIVYVESITNPIVRDALERRGYRLCFAVSIGEASTLDAYKVIEQ